MSGSLFDPPPPGSGEASDASGLPRRSAEGAKAGTPLAERVRPRTLDEILGQDEVLGPGKPLREAIERDLLQSIILWGPPGTGKTTLARVIADMTKAHFVPFSAVLAGIKEIKDVMAAAEDRRRRTGRRTIVFVDEIHRFNKAQQDAFLPRVEKGDIVLIGATTENPSFEVNAALLSRSKVFVLRPLTQAEIEAILRRALADRERGVIITGSSGRSGSDSTGAGSSGRDSTGSSGSSGRDSTGSSGSSEGTKQLPDLPDLPVNTELHVTDAAISAMARFANGDARAALNLLEFSAAAAPMDPETGIRQLDLPQLEQSIQRRALLYDKSGEEHYNLISALHKSMRNSDPDAAVYWVARMLEAGEDPLYIARRLVRFASEDVGNADPQALVVAVAAKEAVHFIGMPEGSNALAQAAIYLATAPKSNAINMAYSAAATDAHQQAADPVPLHLRNAPTKLMKDLNYGKDYRYAHDERDAIADMSCLPESLAGRKYYQPTERGFEKEIRRRLEAWEKIKADRRRDQ